MRKGKSQPFVRWQVRVWSLLLYPFFFDDISVTNLNQKSVWFFGFLLGHFNLVALPQHLHTIFLCPDVSDRIALSFFKELLNSKVPWKRTGQSCPKRRDQENSCAGAEGELKDRNQSLPNNSGQHASGAGSTHSEQLSRALLRFHAVVVLRRSPEDCESVKPRWWSWKLLFRECSN